MSITPPLSEEKVEEKKPEDAEEKDAEEEVVEREESGGVGRRGLETLVSRIASVNGGTREAIACCSNRDWGA